MTFLRAMSLMLGAFGILVCLVPRLRESPAILLSIVAHLALIELAAAGLIGDPGRGTDGTKGRRP